MSSLNNVLKMVFKLKGGEVIKRTDLANELGVSEKQIARYKKDLDGLFTIESIPGPNGGYKLIDSYFPFKEVLSKEEILLLQHYNKSIPYIDNDKLMKVLDKINHYILKGSTQYSPDIILDSRIKNSDLGDIEDKLYEAISHKYEVIIEYKSNKGIHTERRIRPHKILIYKGEPYILAKCLLRNDIRYFKVVRIKKIIVTTFKFKDDFDAEKYLKDMKENSLGIFYENEYKLKMIIYPPMANTISERIWVDNQRITNNDDGSILFEATMKGGPEIISWILSLRSFVKVIEPTTLREELKEEFKKILENY